MCLRIILFFAFFLFTYINEVNAKINEKEVLAIVNGEPITVKEVMYVIGIEHRREDIERKAKKVDLKSFLNQIIRDKLIIQEAKMMGLETNPWLEAKLNEFIIASAVRQLYKDEIVSKIKSTHNEVKNFYKQFYKEYEIYIFETKDKNEAEKVRNEFMQNKNGKGNKVKLTLLNLYNDEELWDKIKNLKPGEVSPVIQKFDKYIVIKILQVNNVNMEKFNKNYNSIKLTYERYKRKELETIKLKDLRNKYKNLIWIDKEILQQVKTKSNNIKEDNKIVAKVGKDTLKLNEILKNMQNNNSTNNFLNIDKYVNKWIDTKIVDLEALSRNYHLRSPLKEDIENYKNQLLKKIFISVVILPKIKIDDKDLKEYYNENKEKFKEEDQYRIYRMIVKDHNTALSVISELSKGADFKFLAKKFSVDENVQKTGGDMGWIKYSLIPEPYRKSFQKLEKKEITMLQEGPHWTILYIADVKPGKIKSFESLKSHISNEVMTLKVEKELDEYAKKLKSSSKIIIYENKVKNLEKMLF
ncbi:MAG: peptidyl-prolyl cis-trans isomerase [Nitrososphaerota archaeon]